MCEPKIQPMRLMPILAMLIFEIVLSVQVRGQERLTAIDNGGTAVIWYGSQFEGENYLLKATNDGVSESYLLEPGGGLTLLHSKPYQIPSGGPLTRVVKGDRLLVTDGGSIVLYNFITGEGTRPEISEDLRFYSMRSESGDVATVTMYNRVTEQFKGYILDYGSGMLYEYTLDARVVRAYQDMVYARVEEDSIGTYAFLAWHYKTGALDTLKRYAGTSSDPYLDGDNLHYFKNKALARYNLSARTIEVFDWIRSPEGLNDMPLAVKEDQVVVIQPLEGQRVLRHYDLSLGELVATVSVDEADPTYRYTVYGDVIFGFGARAVFHYNLKTSESLVHYQSSSQSTVGLLHDRYYIAFDHDRLVVVDHHQMTTVSIPLGYDSGVYNETTVLGMPDGGAMICSPYADKASLWDLSLASGFYVQPSELDSTSSGLMADIAEVHGLADGTVLIEKDIYSVENEDVELVVFDSIQLNSDVLSSKRVGEQLFFLTEDSASDVELWSTDGRQYKKLFAVSNELGLSDAAVVDYIINQDKVLLMLIDGLSTRLFEYDLTASISKELDFDPGNSSRLIGLFVLGADAVYLFAGALYHISSDGEVTEVVVDTDDPLPFGQFKFHKLGSRQLYRDRGGVHEVRGSEATELFLFESRYSARVTNNSSYVTVLEDSIVRVYGEQEDYEFTLPARAVAAHFAGELILISFSEQISEYGLSIIDLATQEVIEFQYPSHLALESVFTVDGVPHLLVSDDSADITDVFLMRCDLGAQVTEILHQLPFARKQLSFKIEELSLDQYLLMGSSHLYLYDSEDDTILTFDVNVKNLLTGFTRVATIPLRHRIRDS